MGFYGSNISNSNKSIFTFDHIYETRAAMDNKAQSDGVFLGRYVLVEYDAAPQKAYYKYNESTGRHELYVDNEFRVSINPANVENILFQALNLSGGDIFFRSNGTQFVRESGSLSPYASRYRQDVEKYGRGYDSTAWMKRYDAETNVYKYVMVAELNTVVPNLHIAVDAPSDASKAPYFDSASTNVDYYLHTQPNIYNRIATADASRSDEKITQAIQQWSYDESTGAESVRNIVEPKDADIYYNKKGFESDVHTVSDIANSINFTTQSSGRKYFVSTDMAHPVEDDVHAWHMRLPGIGNAIALMWDKIYGFNGENNSNRYINKAQQRNDNANNLVTYDSTTVMGIINTTQDLLGYYFVPYSSRPNKDKLTGNEMVQVTRTYDKVASGVSEYPAIKCLFYNGQQYYYYAYAPEYSKVTTALEPDQEYYYLKDGVYHLANTALNDATNANGEIIPHSDDYYVRVDAWKLSPLETEVEDTIYGLIVQIHKLLGTNISDERNFDSLQGAINIIKDIVKNIDVNLAPGRLVQTNNDGQIETSDTYFPSADWDKDKILAGDGSWVSRFASVQVCDNSSNPNQKVPEVIKFTTTGETAGSAPAELQNEAIELLADNQRIQDGTTLAYKQEHEPNSLVLATRDKWIKLHPNAKFASIEFEHVKSPIVDNLSWEALDAPGMSIGWTDPKTREDNSTINTNNFKALENGTQILIASDSDNTIVYNNTIDDQNDNRLTIPSVVVDNAGHVIATSTKNYNIPHGFKYLRSANASITEELGPFEGGGVAEGNTVSGSLVDSITLAAANRWMGVTLNDMGGNHTFTVGHRLSPIHQGLGDNFNRHTDSNIVRTVYCFGLENHKPISNINTDHRPVFNVPYLEVDQAGHVVYANTYQVQLPNSFEKIRVLENRHFDPITKEGLDGAADIIAITPTDGLAFDSSNKWIRLKLADKTISIGHELHTITENVLTSENMDSANGTNQFTTETVQWDDAGHITGHNTKTWILPNSLKSFKIGAASTSNTDANSLAQPVTISANQIRDVFNINPANKWIRMYAQEKTLSVGHIVNEIPTILSKVDFGAFENVGDTFTSMTFVHDEAGHITSVSSTTYTMPNCYHTIRINNTDADNQISFSGQIAATSMKSVLTLNSLNEWIQLDVDSGTVNITHKLTDITAGTYGTNSTSALTPSFGATFEVPGYDVDKAGHIISTSTHTVQMPQNSYSENDDGNLLTSLELIPTTGAITGTRAFVGNLKLNGYDATNVAAAPIASTDSINTAFAKAEAQLAKEIADRISAIEQEAGDRKAAIEKEAADRASAIEKEATDRQTAINAAISQIIANTDPAALDSFKELVDYCTENHDSVAAQFVQVQNTLNNLTQNYDLTIKPYEINGISIAAGMAISDAVIELSNSTLAGEQTVVWYEKTDANNVELANTAIFETGKAYYCRISRTYDGQTVYSYSAIQVCR